MSWKLSRFRTGELVEVRSREEILDTLDQHGCVDNLPFMPEMLQFCGRRLRIRAVAHKTCDTAHQTWTGRRLDATVHLADVLCDGSSHDGCQAECKLFWKDVWLKSAEERDGGVSATPVKPLPRGCTEAALVASTLANSGGADGLRYSCQATKMYDATGPLAWWDLRQYVFDVVTGNHSPGHVLRVLWLASLRALLPRVPFGRKLSRSFLDSMHRALTGRAAPSLNGKIARGLSTPVGRLDLKPGELVRIKSQSEIEKTVNELGKNRGLGFDHEEMAPYCGRVFKVRKSVEKIIDEPTGKMLEMKQPCITLEGVVCLGEYAGCRLNCPRAIPSYWREIWLDRVDASSQSS